MLDPFLPKQPVQKSSPFPSYTKPSHYQKESYFNSVKEVASGLDAQIAELEAPWSITRRKSTKRREAPKRHS